VRSNASSARVIGVLLMAWPFTGALRSSAPRFAGALGWIWERTCHRDLKRTLEVLGAPMPMCSRCAGIVFGLGLGLLALRRWRGAAALRRELAIAAALVLFDVALTPYHPTWHATRLATGIALGFPVASAVAALIPSWARRSARIPG
jgi:uncharacterized membrane protein